MTANQMKTRVQRPLDKLLMFAQSRPVSSLNEDTLHMNEQTWIIPRLRLAV
jgi:hypothetical protein